MLVSLARTRGAGVAARRMGMSMGMGMGTGTGTGTGTDHVSHVLFRGGCRAGPRRLLHAHVFSVLGRDEARVVDELRTQLVHVARQPVPAGGWTLLYAVDKHLSPTHLQQCVSLLRSPEALPHVGARVGALTGSWPQSALPCSLRDAVGLDSAGMPCVAVALFPASAAVAFQSKIKGKRAVAVGRWQPLDVQRQWSSASPPPAAGGGDAGLEQQRDLWSKTNPASSVPPALAPYVPAGTSVSGRAGGAANQSQDRLAGAGAGQTPAQTQTVIGTLLLSDAAPQGLVEGLVHHFPMSPHLGIIAPPTPFETGRDRTLLYDGPRPGEHGEHGEHAEHIHEIFDQGAVGVALLARTGGAGSGACADGAGAWARGWDLNGGESVRPVVRVERAYANLHPMGPRRALTGAEGNVISTLDGENAVEQFRQAVEVRPIRRPDHECVFRIGVYLHDHDRGCEHEHDAHPGHQPSVRLHRIRPVREPRWRRETDSNVLLTRCLRGTQTPAVMATIVGGQSSRGALLLNTDANLGALLLQKARTAPTVQFFQEDPEAGVTPVPAAQPVDAAAAGGGGGARILFATPGGSGSARVQRTTSPGGVGAGAGAGGGSDDAFATGRAVTWAGTFAAASGEGWFEGYATKVPGSAVWMTLPGAGDGCAGAPRGQ